AEMLEELGHAEAYSRRMVFLGGSPVLKAAKVPSAAKSLKEMFEADLVDEKDAINFYTSAARDADEARDIGTRDLFERTALDEEGHMSWLELQLSLLERMGEPAFIAMHVNQPGGE
ncbi:MAG: ferritin-like domain-containing protein, partial [Ruegeria sp.]|nr:ferritin-like domain-containing protein [Ruegeria sp.]